MPSDLIRECAAAFPKEARPTKELGSFLDSIKSGTTLECFREKCAAVFPKEARPNKELGSFLYSIKSGTTLDFILSLGRHRSDRAADMPEPTGDNQRDDRNAQGDDKIGLQR